MAVDCLQEQLGKLNLAPEFLPFSPPENVERRHEKFDDIPRYLFRVFTPNSQGTTNMIWTKSMEATSSVEAGRVDIFARDKRQTADMLYSHLHWWKGPHDNLVSWTSSLLFVLIYIFNLHAGSRDGSTFDNIHLCIVDTSSFPDLVFLRDMDLIRAYRSVDPRLGKFEEFRSGDYYFGEYFSQGALKIEGKCQIISAQQLIERDLYCIRPEFEEFANWKRRETPPWVDPTLQLRSTFCISKENRKEITAEQIQAALSIAELFGPGWKLPMAANLIALAAPRNNDERIIVAFRGNIFTGLPISEERI